jgi:hypothetical protein
MEFEANEADFLCAFLVIVVLATCQVDPSMTSTGILAIKGSPTQQFLTDGQAIFKVG